MSESVTAPGVNLVGHLGARDGLGEAARQLARALDAGGVDCERIDAASAHGPGPHPVNLLCLNPDQLAAFAARAGEEFFAGRPTAGLWWWENPDFPAGLTWAFDYLDEVWVASRFIAGALEPSAPIPIRRIDLPLTPVAPTARTRAELGLPQGFLFLFVFDYLSAARKNPLGAIEAFGRAFEPGSGAALALKAWNAERHPAAARAVREAAARHPDVHLIERVLPEADKNAMIASCDCYLSLHRAEGFGLTIAEATYFGRPVIATGWSGNMELMDGEDSAFAVRFELRPVGPDVWPYRPFGTWAEPDLDHAAGLMRGAFDQPDDATSRGRRASERIRSKRSAEATAGPIAERVTALADAGRGSRTPLPDGTSQRARRRVELGPEPSRRGRLNPLRAIRRALLRVLRPQTAHQQEVDREILEAVTELERRVEELEGRLRP